MMNSKNNFRTRDGMMEAVRGQTEFAFPTRALTKKQGQPIPILGIEDSFLRLDRTHKNNPICSAGGASFG